MIESRCVQYCNTMVLGTGTVESPDFPSNSESCWNVTCDVQDIRTLYFKSEIPYNATYSCFNSRKCEDEWPQKKCKNCNEKKCKKRKSCQKHCKDTCNLCNHEHILAPFY